MRVCVGQILGAHGVRGLVKLASFTEDPEAVAQYGALSDESGSRRFTVSLSGQAKGHWIARIAEISDREAAQALAGLRLFADRDNLPEPEEDEFYHADLIGLPAERTDGSPLGRVVALHNFGAGDIIEIELPTGKRPLLPFNRQTVPVVDLAAGRIVIDPPVGLLSDEPEASASQRRGS